ncbi:hypothetical protein AHAS_Ahas11G0320300 [Arachis hypogaea]
MQNCPTSLPSFSIEICSSLEYTSTQNSFQNPHDSIHQPQQSFHNSQNSFHIPQHNFTTTYSCHQNYSQPSSLELAVEDYLQWSKESLESRDQVLERQGQLLKRHKQSWKDILFKKMDGHLEQSKKNLGVPSIEDKEQSVSEEEEALVLSEFSIENEEVEVCKPRISYPQRPIDVTNEQENLLPTDLMEHFAEEGEEVNQGSPHSIEAESYIEEGFIEPPIQEALDEENTQTITQQSSLDIQEVEATNKSTERGL